MNFKINGIWEEHSDMQYKKYFVCSYCGNLDFEGHTKDCIHNKPKKESKDNE